MALLLDRSIALCSYAEAELPKSAPLYLQDGEAQSQEPRPVHQEQPTGCIPKKSASFSLASGIKESGQWAQKIQKYMLC